jgi:peptide/nickel transport system permease protein
MKSYITKRLIQTIIMFVVVTFIVFVLVYLIPGELDEGIFRTVPNTDYYFHYRAIHGLDKPWCIQYYYFLKGFFTGNLGVLLFCDKPTFELIVAKIPYTLVLQTTAAFLSAVIGIPMGVIAAVRKNTMIGNLISKGSLFSISCPIILAGPVLIFLLADGLGWFPSGYAHTAEFLEENIPNTAEYFLDFIKHLILPVLTMALLTLGYVARMVQPTARTVLRNTQTAARSKRLSERVAIYNHFLRSKLSLNTTFGLIFAFMLGMSPLVESIYSWPGLGRHFLRSIQLRDYLLVGQLVCVLGAFILVSNFLIDVLCRWVESKRASDERQLSRER